MGVQINISNKAVYLLVGLLILVGVTGIAIAWGSGDPAVHGHDAGEIEGIGGGSAFCEVLHVANPSEEMNDDTDSGYEVVGVFDNLFFEIDIPSYCRNGEICRIILVAYAPRSNTKRTLYSKIYRQGLTGPWESERVGEADNSLFGENGDSNSEPIIALTNNYLMLLDDRAVGLTNEIDSNKWIYRDTSEGYYGELITCKI